MKYIIIVILAIVLNACSAMVLKTKRVETDGTMIEVDLRSDREYESFEAIYDFETHSLIIRATDVKTGPDAWAPVIDKLLDKIP